MWDVNAKVEIETNEFEASSVVTCDQKYGLPIDLTKFSIKFENIDSQVSYSDSNNDNDDIEHDFIGGYCRASPPKSPTSINQINSNFIQNYLNHQMRYPQIKTLKTIHKYLQKPTLNDCDIIGTEVGLDKYNVHVSYYPLNSFIMNIKINPESYKDN